MKKTYVLDTNVLLSDPSSITSFEDNDVIIPMIVLEELDNHKSRQDEVGKNARAVSRMLDEMRLKGSLFSGIQLDCGGTLRVATVDSTCLNELPTELVGSKADNVIIAFMIGLTKLDEKFPILVTKDINVRLKCDSLEIKCEDYLKMRAAPDAKKFYRGVEVIELSEELVDKFYIDGELLLPQDVESSLTLFPNQIVVIKNVQQGVTTKSAITKFIAPGKPIVPITKIENALGLIPRNKEQKFSLDLLFDDNIKLVTLVGPAGTGKTLIALAAALEQLKGLGSRPTYEKLIVTRPVLPVGRDIGFLPGTLEEKMEPWIAPIRDNINFLMGSRKSKKERQQSPNETRGFGFMKKNGDEYLSLLQEKGIIEVEAITFIRGRSIPNSFIIIDEAQNLSAHELKTIITRVGDGTKIVLTGDLEQIDNVHVDTYSNGLTYAVEKFKNHSIAGHVTLLKGERSHLATIASQIL